jgi:hypothetical protein
MPKVNLGVMFEISLAARGCVSTIKEKKKIRRFETFGKKVCKPNAETAISLES